MALAPRAISAVRQAVTVILLAGFAVLMYSCSVNREYQRPETGLPQQFRTGSDSRGEPDHEGTASKLSGTDRGAGSGAVAAGQADNLGEAGQGTEQAGSAGRASMERRDIRTEERRVGEEGVRKGRSRWWARKY